MKEIQSKVEGLLSRSHFCHLFPRACSPLNAASFLHLPSLSAPERNFGICNPKLVSAPSLGGHFHVLQPVPAVDMSSSPSNVPSTGSNPFAVLFVCLGNICRSPAAEGVFKGIVKNKGLTANFKIDSAGTIDYHEGNEADPRMRAAAKRRGIEITSISRPIRPADFIDFNLIVAMDRQNRDDILKAFNRWKLKNSLPEDAYEKVKLMCSYCKQHKETEVPDPYYGGPQGFEQVLNILEDACESLLEDILAENRHLSNS